MSNQMLAQRVTLVLLLIVCSNCCVCTGKRRRGGGLVFVQGHQTDANTQRRFFDAQPTLYANDIDGDGIDDWIVTETLNRMMNFERTQSVSCCLLVECCQGSSLFITEADHLAIGKAYSRPPFPSLSPIASVITGSFLGRTQPRLVCALTPGNSSLRTTMNSCGLLHPERFEMEWVVRHQSMPFVLSHQGTGVDLFVGDFDGDGKDDMLTYSSADGATSIYSLRAITNSTFQFVLSTAEVMYSDVTTLAAAPFSSMYGVSRTHQSVHVGQLFDCSCSNAGEAKRCSNNVRKHQSSIHATAEHSWHEPFVPTSPPDINEGATRPFALDISTPINSYPTDDFVFVDRARGVMQAFASCVDAKSDSRSPSMIRMLVTPAGLVRPSDRVSITNIRGSDLFDDLILHSPGSMPRVYSIQTDPISGGRLERVRVAWGELGKFLQQNCFAGYPCQIAWMRIKKSRIIAPNAEVGLKLEDRSASPVSDVSPLLLPSPSASSYLRSDSVVWNPSTRMFHFFAASFVISSTKGRVMEGGHSVEVVHSKNMHSIAPPSPIPSPWLGQRSYVFSFAQFPLKLREDQDQDGILTVHELGGLDPNATGISVEPLHSFVSSPFRPDVFVEVDWMEDEAKSMRPQAEFDAPAKEDLKNHGIQLHVFLDAPIPRVANLGGTNFVFSADFLPLKWNYFTRSRIGLFHYCAFIDRFNDANTSGQSAGVLSSTFFVSLGGWSGGHGTLAQQQGTFLHELGHNLNLLHGGNDDINWKPNHLSVMNYAFQVSGVLKDGQRKMVLSDLDCSSVDENTLNEFTGIRCRQGHASKGSKYQTLIDGRRININAEADFNDDGEIQKGHRRKHYQGKQERLRAS